MLKKDVKKISTERDTAYKHLSLNSGKCKYSVAKDFCSRKIGRIKRLNYLMRQNIFKLKILNLKSSQLLIQTNIHTK